jgi:NTP pyrophosphatase (non-canonical NTP hydrolase)
MPSMITDKLDEALTILAEECGELVQVISKIRRFGIEDNNVKNKREWLAQEIGDVAAMIDVLIDQGELTPEIIEQAKQTKKDKLRVYSNLFK